MQLKLLVVNHNFGDIEIKMLLFYEVFTLLLQMVFIRRKIECVTPSNADGPYG